MNQSLSGRRLGADRPLWVLCPFRPTRHAPSVSLAAWIAVRRPRTLAGHPDRRVEIRIEEHGHRRQPHDTALSSGPRVGGTAERLACLLGAVKSTGDCVPNIETPAIAAQVAGISPPAVAKHLVLWVETPEFD